MKKFAYQAMIFYTSFICKLLHILTEKEEAMEKHIIFGGTGFIGSHVVEVLTKQNVKCSAIVRKTSNTRFLEQLGVEIIRLDSFAESPLSKALQNCDVVYNCIADVHPHKSLEDYNKTQVELTTTIAKAAIQAKVKRFVQLSTVEVYGDTPNDYINEDYALNPLFTFQQSMLDREIALKNLAKNQAMELVLLRPAGTIGRRSIFMNMFKTAHAKGRFPVIAGGITISSMIDTRDIGRAMLFLGRQPTLDAQTFVVKGYEASWMDIKNAMDKVVGKSTKIQNLPKAMASFLGGILKKITPYGKVPFLTPFMVHVTTQPLLIDDSRLHKLGFTSQYSLLDSVEYVMSEREEPIEKQTAVMAKVKKQNNHSLCLD
jgi:dihydroflavonol-4-reductase